MNTFLYCQYPCCIGQVRFIVATFALLAVMVGFAQHASMSIAIVEMVDSQMKNASCFDSAFLHVPNMELNISGERMKWSEIEQGFNLAAFYIGYVITTIPAGILCDKYGARYVLLSATLLSSLATVLIPIGASMARWWEVCILRVVKGLGQGAIFPCVSSLISRWIPPLERSTVVAAVFAANSIGIVLGYTCTGLLIYYWGSWPVAFYFWAGVGLLYSLLYGVYVFSDPQTHPQLHKSEFDYLAKTMVMKKSIGTPYKLIFQDRCVYGLIICQMGHDLLLYTLINNFPKYLNQVLGFNIMENSLMGLLFLLLWVSGFFGGMLADFLITKKNISVTLIRRLYTSTSNLGSYLFVCFAVIARCRMEYAITSFAVAIFLKGFFYTGGFANIIDISVHHTGFIISLINLLGATMGVTCSTMIGFLAQHNTIEEWELIVAVMGLFEVISILLYFALSTARRRDWDYAEDEEMEPRPLQKRWYKHLSDSDHELRMEEERRAHEVLKENARTARAQMKEDIRNR